jgi:hypothetical protein
MSSRRTPSWPSAGSIDRRARSGLGMPIGCVPLEGPCRQMLWPTSRAGCLRIDSLPAKPASPATARSSSCDWIGGSSEGARRSSSEQTAPLRGERLEAAACGPAAIASDFERAVAPCQHQPACTTTDFPQLVSVERMQEQG